MTGRTNPIAIAIFVLLVFFQGLPVASAQSTGIKWYPYEEGMALGKSQVKKVFINFYAKWCSYCKKMETKTFRDSSVIAYINENFIAVNVDVDNESHVAAQYNISPLPDLWFVSEKGEAIGNKPGYVTAKELLPVLKFIHTESYLTMSYMQFLDSQ